MPVRLTAGNRLTYARLNLFSVIYGPQYVKLGIGAKLFLYTGAILAVVLLTAFFVLERNQASQWHRALFDQSRAFVRFATPEVMKLFRGQFAGDSPAHHQVGRLLAANPDLMRVALYSARGRRLYLSDPFGLHRAVPLPETLESTDLGEGGRGEDVHAWLRELPDGPPVLDLLVPVAGPTGERILFARYLVSTRQVAERIGEIRVRFALIAIGALGISLLLAGLVARRFTRPLEELTRGVRAIGEGRLDTKIPVDRQDEVGELALAFNEMAASLDASRRSLTERNRELHSANEELRRVQMQLIRSERLAAIGQLAAGVSHEIDNPVGIILGYAELLLEDLAEDDPRRDDVLGIIEECRRCRRITGGLLGLARSVPEEMIGVDLHDLAAGIFDSLRPQKLFRQVELVLRPANGPFRVMGDADQLRQVLVNLLLNAAQAMEGQGRIEVELRAGGEQVELLVRDSGPGVPKEIAERIFEPFYSTKSGDEGTGLGLSLCRKLVEDHGGSLDLVETESGACFRLILPGTETEKSFDNQKGDFLP